jgi:hypothetical protein
VGALIKLNSDPDAGFLLNSDPDQVFNDGNETKLK